MNLSVHFGQRFFSVMSHKLYDVSLYRWITSYVWRCPTEELVNNYVEHVSDNHLEAGVGTGYLLEKTMCPEFTKRLVLMDLNRGCLAKAAERLKHLSPKQTQHNITQPITEYKNFKSVGINYVLHCIPGSFWYNRDIFKHLSDVLTVDGVLFGATLLNLKSESRWSARIFMALLNMLGIFHNDAHRFFELKQALELAFQKVEIRRVGNAVIFQAWKG